MKKFLKITLLILITQSVSAQSTKSVEVRATKSVYIYKHTSPRGVVAVHKKNSISSDDVIGTKLNRLSYFPFTSDKPISKSIFEVLNQKRLEELKSERLLVNTFLNSRGKITAIEYYLEPDSKITVKELEKLEDAFFQNVAYDLLKQESTRGPLAPITHVVQFKNYLNGVYN